MENLIQATPIKTVGIAVFQTIGFRPTPFRQWVTVFGVLIVFPFQPVFFISRKANQLNNGVFFTKMGEILIDDSGFQFSSTPTGLRPRPALTFFILQFRVVALGLVFKHEPIKRF